MRRTSGFYPTIMDRSAREPITSIDFASGPRWTVERHVMVRIEYIVGQVAVTHAGQPEAGVARVISDRLRGLGVNPQLQQVQHYALAISQLQPPAPPRPR
jgi:hypothetical protein